VGTSLLEDKRHQRLQLLPSGARSRSGRAMPLVDLWGSDDARGWGCMASACACACVNALQVRFPDQVLWHYRCCPRAFESWSWWPVCHQRVWRITAPSLSSVKTPMVRLVSASCSTT